MKIELIKETEVSGKIYYKVQADGNTVPRGLFDEGENQQAENLYNEILRTGRLNSKVEVLKSSEIELAGV